MRSHLYLSSYHQLLWADRLRFSWIPKGSDRLSFRFQFFFDSVEVFHENHIAVLLHDHPAIVTDTFPVEAQRFFPDPKPPQPDWEDHAITSQSANPRMGLQAGHAFWFLDHHTQDFAILRYLESSDLPNPKVIIDDPYIVTRSRSHEPCDPTRPPTPLPSVIAINPKVHRAANPKEPLPTTSNKQHFFQVTYKRNSLFYVLSPLYQPTFVSN